MSLTTPGRDVPPQQHELTDAGVAGKNVPARVWTLALRAPAPWLSANDTINRYTRAEYVARWRAAAFVAAAKAHLPKGLARVRIQPSLHFADHRKRDAP